MKDMRLKKRSDFLSVSKSRKAFFTPHFTLQYLLKSEQLFPRFGFTASKKVGGAVTRNRIKRRLREVTRLFSKQHSGELSLFSYDFALIARASAFDAPFSDLMDHFKRALRLIIPPNRDHA